MPKGVEHSRSNGNPTIACPMRNSVMPKGVEHQRAADADRDYVRMRNSVMPKGVEHPIKVHDAATWKNAEFSDAERR